MKVIGLAHSLMVTRRLPRLDVVIVNWNSGARLDRCLASLAAASRDGFTLHRIVIVDNASDEPIAPYAETLARDYDLPIFIIRNASNRGFAPACLQGAAGSRADYLLFLNPDTRVDASALSAAVAALESPRYRATGILGLPLVDEDGAHQPTCGRFLTVGRMFNQITGLTLLAPRAFPGCRMTDWDHLDTRTVDFVSGACLLVRRPLYEQLGGFDPRFIVYLEDADLALRARRLGWDTVFLAGPPVYHEGGWGTGTARSLRLAHAWRSLLAYGIKHFRPFSACAATAMVLAVAPIARAGEAMLHRSPRELVDACLGYGRLWALVIADLASAGRRRGEAIDTGCYNDAFPGTCPEGQVSDRQGRTPAGAR